MMEDGYRPKGWLEMLFGVRLYYEFCGATLESDEAFEGKIEELCRELGGRATEGSGFARVPEAVPPYTPLARTTAESVPTQHAVAVVAPSPSLAAASPPPQQQQGVHDYTVRHAPATMAPPSSTSSTAVANAGAAAGGSFAELCGLLRHEQARMDAKIEQLQAASITERAQTLEMLRGELTAAISPRPAPPPQEVVSAQQLEAFQGRLEGLHATQLISDAERDSCEDMVADFVEATACFEEVTMEVVCAIDIVRQVHGLIALSGKLRNDLTFARQLRRKAL